jgi:hypothetical protein
MGWLTLALQQTFELCPNGPQALASCVCLKDGMTSEVLKELTSSVKEICSSTATEDVTSAVAVSAPNGPDGFRAAGLNGYRCSTSIAALPRRK